MQSNRVSEDYLRDIEGKLDFPDFDELIKAEGLFGLVPENIAKYAAEIEKAEDDGVHQYLCNIDKAPSGCQPANAIAAREKDRLVGYVQWDVRAPYRLLYSVDGHLVEREIARKQKVKPIPLAKRREGIGKKERGSNLGRTVTGQGLNTKAKGTFYTRSVKPDRKGDTRQLFRDAVEGKGNLSIGDRAVLFNQDGSITTGANNIRDNAVENERSSNIPSESANNGAIPAKVKPATPYKTSQHPNKSRLAKTNDIAGGVAALGGIAAVVGVIALLLPQHFVTSAITFLTSITTFFTNVNNAVNTYLTVVDALLGIFGIKGSGKAVKGFITQIVDNALGKENVQQVKNAFASGINTIAVTTKLLEKTQAIANNTDDKVDEVALKLGAVNNAMGAAGLIPPELMATSKGIDDLVAVRTKDNEELAGNLTALTKEISTNEESKKELADEQKARDKVKAKKDKDLGDVKKLLDVAKTDVEKIKVENL
jgi:hypothetical protein